MAKNTRIGGEVIDRGRRIDALSVPLFVSEPPRGWVSLELTSLGEYRELLYFLVWRDVKIRYKQTAMGVIWAVLQPFLTMIIFSVIFGALGKIPSDGIPYPIFAYSALLPWQLFSHSLATCANSLVLNQDLLTKVYFPRLLIPLSTIFVAMIDFGMSILILFMMMFYYNIVPTLFVLLLPVLMVLVMVAALSVGLWLATLNVQYRDIHHTVPFIIQFWMFLTPIAYPVSLIPEQWRVLYGLNPMVGVVEGFRWILLNQDRSPDISIIISTVVSIILLIGGLIYFKYMEQTFADVI